MIGIIAGTSVDTAFGFELVKKVTDHYVSLAISQIPEEQTVFQVLPEADKKALLTAVLKDFSGKRRDASLGLLQLFEQFRRF